MVQEFPEAEGGFADHVCGMTVRYGQVHRNAGLKYVHQHHAQQQTQQRCTNKPKECLATNSSHGFHVAKFRNTYHQRKKYQRCDDHFYQPQKNFWQDGERIRYFFEFR